MRHFKYIGRLPNFFFFSLLPLPHPSISFFYRFRKIVCEASFLARIFCVIFRCSDIISYFNQALSTGFLLPPHLPPPSYYFLSCCIF